jgi:hypothetical protein
VKLLFLCSSTNAAGDDFTMSQKDSEDVNVVQ